MRNGTLSAAADLYRNGKYTTLQTPGQSANDAVWWWPSRQLLCYRRLTKSGLCHGIVTPRLHTCRLALAMMRRQCGKIWQVLHKYISQRNILQQDYMQPTTHSPRVNEVISQKMARSFRISGYSAFVDVLPSFSSVPADCFTFPSRFPVLQTLRLLGLHCTRFIFSMFFSSLLQKHTSRTTGSRIWLRYPSRRKRR